ncbi:MAG: class I SAM-dependent methyltransferase [Spirochaetes bacterium]|nr:class I SAM-dependent methyltransferase [Spirochaetota bacterium]
MTEIRAWDKHYTKAKSVLTYPDENLVRMIKTYLTGRTRKEVESLCSIDLGCGTGRHLKFLSECGIQNIIGLDTSMNSLKICKELYPYNLVRADNKSLPFRDSSFDLAISWGSLHYCTKDLLYEQISEIYRVMKNGSRFFGTLRSGMDTYLKKGRHIGNDTWITDIEDLKNSVVSFYNEKELKLALRIFSGFEYGIIERTILGDINKRISHWIFRAEK